VHRVVLLGLAVVFVAAACGGGGPKTYTAAKTRECLAGRGATVGGPLDFVASTALGGAFVVHVHGNWVTVAFGKGQADAERIQQAYDKFALPNVKAGLPDVLRRYSNAIMLWHAHPSSSQLSEVADCLH